MYDEKIFKETFSAIKASENTLTEVLKMTTKMQKKPRYKRMAAMLAAIITLLGFTMTALAYSGLLGWIFVDRDLDTKQLSEKAQDALNNFTGISPKEDTTAKEQYIKTSAQPADSTNDEVSYETLAQNAVGRLFAQLENNSLPELKLSDFAMETDDGTITFYFSPGDNPLYERSILVTISSDSEIFGIDLRNACPYPQPKNCPDEYIVRMTHLSSGIEHDFFNSDAYLLEVAYPNMADRATYSSNAEAAAENAMAQLYENGFISAKPDEIEIIYFETFNGGAAWVDVLMKNGDVYCLYLQPDDFSILGFALRTKEQLAAGNGNAALYSALRNGTLEEYQSHMKDLIENHSVG